MRRWPSSAAFARRTAWRTELDPEVAALRSEFIGYPNVTSADDLGWRLRAALPGEPSAVVLDRTPFYAEGGGQIGDRGALIGRRTPDRDDTQRVGDAIVHLGILEGSLSAGDAVRGRGRRSPRWAAAGITRAPTCCIGRCATCSASSAKQAGSWVGPEGLRFDFPAAAATPREALREVERIVNAQIRRDATVTPEFMPIEQAQALGADMFFGEKYVPESVRVVQVDGFSKELCGGTHVASTGQIGSAADHRRVERRRRPAADRGGHRRGGHRARRGSAGGAAKHGPAAGRARGGRSAARREPCSPGCAKRRRPRRLRRAAAQRLDAAAALHSAQQAGKTKVIIDSYADADAAALRGLADDLRGMTGRFVAVVGGATDGKPTLLVASSRDLAAEGFDAGRSCARRRRSSAAEAAAGPTSRRPVARTLDRLDDALREAGRLALEALARIETP